MRLLPVCMSTLFCSTVLALVAEPASGQFRNLLKRVPQDANVIVMINVEKVHRSPLAVRENWKKRHAEAFAAGGMRIPPKTRTFVMAAEIDLQFMQPVWEVVLMEMEQVPELSLIARTHNGVLDDLGGATAVSLPHDAYVVQFDQSTLGGMSPANRQLVARWLREGQQVDAVALSPYLTEASAYPDRVGTEIIMAVDLENALNVGQIEAGLKESEDFKNYDAAQLSQILASIRGATLGVNIGDRPYGKLKVDFGKPLGPLAKVGDKLVVGTLQNFGASIDELENWTATIDNQQIALEGYFTEAGLRRVLSVIQPPTSAVRMGEQQQQTTANLSPEQQKQQMGYASKQYFDSVVELIDDLKEKNKDVNTIGQVGVWFDRYAAKIDSLPMLNVDEKLLDYGASVGTRFRDAAMAVKGIGISSAARTRQVYPQASGTYGYSGSRWGRYGWYGGGGYWEMNNVQGERRAIRYQERAKGANSALTITQGIANDTAAIRREMTQKYQLEF